MNFLIVLLLALKGVRVFAFHYSNQVDVVDYNAMGQGSCPKIKQPLCATNGVETLYFDNKCFLEVKNFEMLMQGLPEFSECPLSYCSTQCMPCQPVYEPVCAIDVLNGQMENYQNPCEVQRKICFTQREHRIISSGECSLNSKTQSKCPQFCTLDYNPVCAQLNTELREFANQCQLHKESCETNKDWQIVDYINCASNAGNTNSLKQNSDCPESCTLEYQPICARFMTLEKEFSNECELKTTICQTKQKWHIVRYGACQESLENSALDLKMPQNSSAKPKCPEFCTLEYSPLCVMFGNELKEFANRCELDTNVCQTRQEWQIIANGQCPRDLKYKFDLLSKRSKCPLFCTLEFNPICAKFKNKLREFPNKCQLESTICETEQDWEIVLNGPCPSSASSANKAVKLSEVPKCPTICTLEYNPICAKFNNELREFSNPCYLMSTICETNEKWEIVNLGTCVSDPAALLSFQDSCPKFCTREYNPVCAKFENLLREFTNKCELQKTSCELQQNWVIVNVGICPSNSHNLSVALASCPKFCTQEYIPICAEFNSELREFGNKCELQKTICETNNNWLVVNKGPCSAQSLCPKLCTKEFRPVCARFKGQLREFINNCEFQKTVCETNIDWELINSGSCLVTTFKKDSIDLQPNACANKDLDPICAILDFQAKTFNNLCQLLEEIKSTGNGWSILHQGICKTTTPTTTTFEAESSEIAITTAEVTPEVNVAKADRTTETTTETTTARTTKTTTSRTTGKPKTTTRPMTTQKSTDTQPKLSITPKPSTTAEPRTTTTKTITATTTTPKTTTIASTHTNDQYVYEYSTEDNTAEIDDSSKVSYSDHSSHEDNISYSVENVSDEKYDSWEDEEEDEEEEDEEEENEEVEHENETASKINSPYIIEGNTNSYKHNDSNSTYTFNYGKEKGHSEKNEAIKNTSEKTFNHNLGNVKQEINLKKNSNNQNVENVKQTVKAFEHNIGQTIGSSDNQTNEQNFKMSVSNESKNLVKLIQERISEVSRSHQTENRSEEIRSKTKQVLEIKPLEEEPVLDSNYIPEHNEHYEHLIEHIHSNDESLEANISYEEDQPQEPRNTNENEPKFGVYSDEAYGLMDIQKVNKNFEWSGQGQYNNYNEIYTNNNMGSSNQYNQILEQNEQTPKYSLLNSASSFQPASLKQEEQILKQNAQIPKYTNSPSQINNTANAEHVLQVFEALLSESDAEEEDDETLVKQVLSTLVGETTVAYPQTTYEHTENQLNHTKREKYPSKYNATNAKKGEIYNGAVYKAPVYDAPTYNFIYAAPNHPVLPLMPHNNPFLNYPGFISNHADPTANQTNLLASADTVPATYPHFNPLQFLSSLAAMSGNFGNALPNVMPATTASQDESSTANSNQLVADNSIPLLAYNPSKLPLNPNNPSVYNHLLPQNHPPPQMFLPVPPEQFLSSLSSINGIASQLHNILTPQKQQPENNYQNNLNTPAELTNYKSNQPLYPFPTLPVSMYNSPANSQLPQPHPLLPLETPSNGMPNFSFQPSLPFFQPSLPLQFPPPAVPLPFNALNATLINQITETLKTITSRY